MRSGRPRFVIRVAARAGTSRLRGSRAIGAPPSFEGGMKAGMRGDHDERTAAAARDAAAHSVTGAISMTCRLVLTAAAAAGLFVCACVSPGDLTAGENGGAAAPG